MKRVKKKRLSIAIRIYLMLIVTIAAIFAVVFLISNSAYRTAVFTPYAKRLAGAELPVSELRPFMDYALKHIGTKEMDEVLSDLTEGDEAPALWLLEHAEDSVRDGGEANVIYFSEVTERFREGVEADEIYVDIVKDGKAYGVYQSVPALSLVDRAKIYGTPSAQAALSAADFASPVYRRADRGYEFMRCVRLELAGGEGRFWIREDLNDVVRDSNRFLLINILTLVGMTIAASVILLYLLRRSLIRPVVRMVQATKEFVPEEDGTYSADKVSRIRIREGNELGDLNDEIRTMQERIVEDTGNLARMSAERERISTALELAGRIQASALPKPLPEREEFLLSASMTPALTVGGDFYDFFLIDEDRLALVIADVSGKGIPAALFMMSSKSVIKEEVLRDANPAEAMKKINDRICSNNEDNMFVTVWLGVLDLKTGTLRAVNAGHEYPVILRGGRYELFWDKHGTAAGMMPKMNYKEYELRLEPGDGIFVYSDGLAEANDADKQMFGTGRMLEALRADPGAEPEKVLQNILEAVHSFVQDAEQFDDLTMLCVKYRGNASGSGDDCDTIARNTDEG